RLKAPPVSLRSNWVPPTGRISECVMQVWSCPFSARHMHRCIDSQVADYATPQSTEGHFRLKAYRFAEDILPPKTRIYLASKRPSRDFNKADARGATVQSSQIARKIFPASIANPGFMFGWRALGSDRATIVFCLKRIFLSARNLGLAKVRRAIDDRH